MNAQILAIESEAQERKTVILGSKTSPLTPEQIYEVAFGQSQVKISSRALSRVKQAHEIVIQAIRNNQPIYGLTVGVGWNKDKAIFDTGGDSFESLLSQSRQHNRSSLRAHAAGVGRPLAEATVRAAMLIRLDMMLIGASGVQPAVVELLKEFIQNGITPVVPGKGSVGMADITQNAHIGLALMGEWDVMYQNQRMPASNAMELAGLHPVRLVGKDFLALVSSNNITSARFSLVLSEISLFIKRLEVLFPLTLEAMNANLTPFIDAVTSARPYSGMKQAAENLCKVLQDSDLWKPAPNRHLQDSLSIRDIAYTVGQLIEAQQYAYVTLSTHLNHSDDNPLVVIGNSETRTSLDEQYQIRDDKGAVLGAIYPSANYDGQPLAIAMEHLLTALSRTSNILSMQLINTSSPEQTGLPRFLTHLESKGHAFGALQKPMLALDKENQFLAQPVSLGHAVMAGGIEDVATFGMLAVEHLELVLENLYEMASLHLLHMSQAIDFRPGFNMSSMTRKLYTEYRKLVPYVAKDRIFTKDIHAGVTFLTTWIPEQ